MEKRCAYCREYKPFSEFTFKDKKKGLFNSRCKECKSAYRLSKEHDVPFEELRVYMKDIHACQICEGSFDVLRKCLDHDHKTGEIRGVLCNKCNAGVGLLGDSMEAVEKALAYLYNVKMKNNENK